MTPSSSTRFIFSSSPVVTAMAACFGLRPVANAFGRRVVDDVDARLGQPAGDAQPLDEVVQALVLLGVGRLGAADRERDRVGLPVRHEGHDAGRARARRWRPIGPAPKSRPNAAADERRAATTKPTIEQRAAPLVGADQFEHERLRLRRRDAATASLRSELDLGHLAGGLVGLEVLAALELQRLGEDHRRERLRACCCSPARESL